MSFIGPRSHAKAYDRLNDRVQARQDALRDRMRDRATDTDVPSEHLVCPQCRAEYDQGTSCLSCDAPLVGASLVDAYLAPAEDHMGRRIVMIAVALFVLLGAGSWLL